MRSDTPHRVEIGERRWPTTPVLATGLRRANGGDGHGRAAPGLPNGAGMGYRLMILYKPSPKVGKNPNGVYQGYAVLTPLPLIVKGTMGFCQRGEGSMP